MVTHFEDQRLRVDHTIVDEIKEKNAGIEINIKDFTDKKSGTKNISSDNFIISFGRFFLEIEFKISFLLKVSRKKNDSVIASNYIKSEKVINQNAKINIRNVFFWDNDQNEYDFYPLSFIEERDLKRYLIQNVYLG